MVIGVKIYQNDGVVHSTCTGGETTRSFDFPIYSSSHLRVVRTRSAVDTVFVLNTDYTVPSGSIGVEGGGTINLTSPAVAGDKFTLLLNVPEERTTDFNQNGDFLADTLNRELDLITQQNQQSRRDINKTLSLAETSTATGIVVPNPEANKVLGWNAAGDNLENFTPNTGAYLNVSAFMQTVLDDTTAAAARATLGAGDVFLTTQQTLTTKFLEDSTVRFVDNVDTSKRVAFECSSITTSTTRVVTVPDKDGTLAMTSDIPTIPTNFIKGWAKFTGTALTAGSGITSIASGSTGNYTVTIPTQANANYAPQITCGSAGDARCINMFHTSALAYTAPTTTSFIFSVADTGNTARNYDYCSILLVGN